VLTINEAPKHPQVEARDVYAMFNGLRQPSPAPRFSGTPFELRGSTPSPGPDSRQALVGWGIPPEQIAAWKRPAHWRRAATRIPMQTPNVRFWRSGHSQNGEVS
jgi:crotonobetainyl-CoA:carnitine CoA-transferase CaiB-like acyl-CoA transferase